MSSTPITAKDLQRLPKGAGAVLMDRINTLITAGGGSLDLSSLFTASDDIEEALLNIAKGQDMLAMVGVHKVRGVVDSDVADLGVFTVAGNDGLTYVEGETVFLAGQSTGAENGPYVVGAVGGGTAALTRRADWAAAAVIPTGTLIVVDAGTNYGNSIIMVTNAGDVTVDTTTPTFEFFRSLIDGRNVANVADANTVGGVPIVFRATLPSGANANTDVTVDAKVRVIDAWVVMKGAGTSGAAVTVQEGANAITDAIDVSSASDKDLVRAGQVDDAEHEIPAAGTLRFASASAGADFAGAEAYVLALPVA